MTRDGISVVICCYNSRERLPKTIEKLAAQRLRSAIPWEVIVVDNNSSDDTAEVARRSWPEDAPAPLRVVREPRSGLSFARHRGIEESRYELINFVDDDNWVCPNWIQTIWEVMHSHPEVGACGGPSEAVLEGDEPEWFSWAGFILAVSPPDWEGGDITDKRLLWGAGLTIRRQAWDHLVQNGFRPLLVGRQGTALTSGEDSELCLALRLSGWRLWYEPSLRLQHFMPKRRVDWMYLRKIYRATGAAGAVLSAYHACLEERQLGWIDWLLSCVRSVKHVVCRPSRLLRLRSQLFEGDGEVLSLESDLGRLMALWQLRKDYVRNAAAIRAARWRRKNAVAESQTLNCVSAV